jgi:hypothetical protein
MIAGALPEGLSHPLSGFLFMGSPMISGRAAAPTDVGVSITGRGQGAATRRLVGAQVSRENLPESRLAQVETIHLGAQSAIAGSTPAHLVFGNQSSANVESGLGSRSSVL